MDVTLGGVVLFLHIAVAIVGFTIAGIMHTALQSLARASEVREMRSWAAVVHRLDPLFPLVAVLLLALGSWLVHLSGGEFRWSDGWIVTAVAALVVIEAAAGAMVAPRAKRFVHDITHMPDGPVPADLHARALDPALWHLTHVASVGFLGVVFLMAAKPSGAWSVIIVVVAVAIGVALSQLQLRGLGALSTTRTAPQEVAATDTI